MTVTTSRRRLGALALCISLIAVVASACGGGGDSDSSSLPSGVVAKVDSTDITQTQFNQLMSAAQASYKANKKKFPAVGSAEYATVQQQAVTELVQEAEIAIGAKDLNVNVTDADVEKALDTIKKQYFSDPKTKKFDPEEVRRRPQGAEHDGRAGARSAQAEAARRQDHRQADQERHGQQRRDRRLLREEQVAVRGARRSDTCVTSWSRRRHRPTSCTQQLKNSDKDFAALAKKYSTDTTSAVNGGDLKMIQKGQTVPTFDAVAFKEPVEQGLGAGQVDLRLPPDRGARPGHAGLDAQARRHAQGLDQDAAHRHRQAEEDQRLAERRQERPLEEDLVREGLRAHLDVDHRLDRHDHRVARAAGRARRRARPR